MNKSSRRAGDLIAEEVAGDGVLYQISNKAKHHLSSTLWWIWKHCDGSRSIAELTTAMRDELGYHNAADIVASGLQQLALANLLEPGFAGPCLLGADSSSVNRRC